MPRGEGMTALIEADGELAVSSRQLPTGWARWVEDTAVGGPLPLRLLCEAQLGFEYWWAGRAGAARRPAERRVDALLVAALALAVTALASGINLQATGRALVFEHLPTGPAALLAEQTLVVEGGEAAKGSTPDRVAPPPVPPSLPELHDSRSGPAEPAVVPALRGALPVGKGMWIWLAERTEGGDAQAIVARAQAAGLNHLYVRTASLRQGFYAGEFLDRLLPLAHAARIRVYAWDFPYLRDVGADVNRALQAIHHTTPDGHRVDGYVADIELRSQGVNITPETARAFGEGLRRGVGPNYPLIACVPRPSPRIVQYPFADVVASFDAIAPMNYWLGRDPVVDVTGTFRDLAGFGKPIIPVGQAYDGRSEGGPPGVPPPDQLFRFMQAGEELGAVGVSWWSWQHADHQAWEAVRDAEQFRLPPGPPDSLRPGQVRAYQVLLSSLGFPAPHTGVWDEPTVAALKAYQQAARLPASGIVDEPTHAVMFTPFPAPIQPQA